METYIDTNGPKRSVLIVEDEFVNREILTNILQKQYDVSSAGNGEEAYEMLTDRPGRFSLILLDLLMPVMDGFELLEKIKAEETLKGIPVIVMTSEKQAEVRSIQLGAADFITKPYDTPEVILARCARIIQLYEEHSIIKAAEKDELTGLYTREFFFEYIRRIDAYNGNRPVDAVVLDIEHFHMLNATYGRSAGDEVLKRTASILLKTFSDGSIGCRPDADIFYFYVKHRDDYDNVFGELHQELAKLSKMPKIRFRIGIYQNVDKTTPMEEWFDHAKLTCDRIRGDYTRQVSFYSKELYEADLYHERLINDIDKAIEDNDLVVYFQPKYAIQGEKPVLKSAEALVRWNHPELGLINPGDFIPLFESNGLIQKVDHFVWSETARRIKNWKDRYGVTVPVSVNVSRVEIYDTSLEERLLSLLRDNGLTPQDMLLEITESAYSEDAEGLIEVVEHLREAGFKIEMDDFGSGYSSLNMITTIPIDVLKMDMSFIKNMNKDKRSLKLVELVISIARFLDVPVIAEGVEEASQVGLLKEMGCDIIQGYYFSKPLPPGEFALLLEKELWE